MIITEIIWYMYISNNHKLDGGRETWKSNACQKRSRACEHAGVRVSCLNWFVLCLVTRCVYVVCMFMRIMCLLVVFAFAGVHVSW